MKKVGFGTDGWRGVVAREFTFDNLRMVVQAIVSHIKSVSYDGHVVIGHDTRFMSDRFARTAAEVVCGGGLKAVMADGPVSSPMLSGAVVSGEAAGGIIITASHNPYIYNGVKFKAPYGGSAHPGVTSAIEAMIGRGPVITMPYDKALSGRFLSVRDLYPQYEERLFGMVDTGLLARSGYRVAFDCMHGAASVCAHRVFGALGMNADLLRRERDPYFGGVDPEPMERNLGVLMDSMAAGGYDIGFATDGDGDRLGVVGPDGKYITPHRVMGLAILHLVRNRGLSGSVVRTVSMSTLIDRIAAKLGLEVIETPVGFKNICEYMLDGGVLAGGEENGGIGFAGYIPERDGLLGALVMLEKMAVEGRGVTEMLRDMDEEFGEFCYERADIPLSAEPSEHLPDGLEGSAREAFGRFGISSVGGLDGLKVYLEDGSWVLFRQSGTEPVMRVYCEADSQIKTKAIMEHAREVLIGQGCCRR